MANGNPQFDDSYQLEDFTQNEALGAPGAWAAGSAGEHAAKPRGKRHLWIAIVAGIVLLLAAACGGAVWYFQSHALPGVTLWGHSVAGESLSKIEESVAHAADTTAVTVSYDGTETSVTLDDLGVSVDANAIARQAFDAKRSLPWYERYLPWVSADVAPSIDASGADPATLNKKLGITTDGAVDASVTLNDDGEFEVSEASEGTGVDAKPVAEQAVAAVESLGTTQPQTVTLSLTQIEPAVTTQAAQNAKETLESLVENPVKIEIDGHEVASFSAQELLDAATIAPSGTAGDGEVKKGDVIFSASRLQDSYDKDIKASFQPDAKDQSEIVNANGRVLEVTVQGHDGVTVADGGDSNVGTDALKVIAGDADAVSIDGSVTAMKTTKETRNLVADLSDHTLTAYVDGKAVKTVHITAGQGNDYATGKCKNGDMCTPEGNFEVWLKYPEQDMSGTLTLSDGSTETWDVKGVHYVNYFSKSGCAIHRIATDTAMSDAQIAAMGKNTSHGCIGIGWDVAEWFYDFMLMGTSVTVQE